MPRRLDLVPCQCGRMMRPGREVCCRCRRYTERYAGNSLKDLIYHRISDPVVAERHYLALYVQQLVAESAQFDCRGRKARSTNPNPTLKTGGMP